MQLTKTRRLRETRKPRIYSANVWNPGDGTMVAEFAVREVCSPMNGETTCITMPTSEGHSNSSVDSHYSRDEFGHGDHRVSPSNNGDSYPAQCDISNGIKRKDFFSQRKQREFIPDNKKDDSYWDRRRRNNEAAKRSREKRRFNDMILETRVVELSKENHLLKAQLAAIKEKFGISGDSIISVEQVMAAFPSNEQVISQTKRVKLVGSSPMYPPSQNSNGSSLIRPTPSNHPLHLFPIQQPPVVSEPSYQPAEPETYPQPYSYPLPSLLQPQLDVANNSVLNLSCDRSHSQPSPPPCPCPCDNGCESGDENSQPLPLTLTSPAPGPSNNDQAGAGSAVESAVWGGEGSSDERDSGISLGSEWANHQEPPPASPDREPENDSPGSGDDRMKTELARLASEVANLKSFLSIKKPLTGSPLSSMAVLLAPPCTPHAHSPQ
ncbi:UNVERIFIED_CONTAM: hypothetical protein PYX00_010328 [Menopon gallinae]|uniref:BZIP domain-containing protein n=1 Tax=Menopon gallinae TaxID=328185 RepID=A0AAW2HEZ7_9NEOP